MRNLLTTITALFLMSIISISQAQNMTINLTSPAKNARFAVCSDITLAAAATVQTGTIKRVSFYANGTLVRADNTAPYEATWKSVPDGLYEIVATGVDGDNVSTSTKPIFIYVGNSPAGNMVENGEFNCALAPWFLDNYVNAVSTVTIVPDLWLTDDSSGVLVEIQNQGDQVWAIQLMQPFQIKAGHSYEITFEAQADAPKAISVDISKNYDDFAPLNSYPFTVDQAQTYGPVTFDAAADDNNLMFKFVLGGNTIPIEIDAVRVIDKQWTAVQDNPAATIDAFELQQNYPNPFNPQTTITWSLPHAGVVDLAIYNILGEKVLRHTAMESAGSHSLTWNGLDAAGQACPSGVYIYQLKMENRVLAKKMQLLR